MVTKADRVSNLDDIERIRGTIPIGSDDFEWPINKNTAHELCHFARLGMIRQAEYDKAREWGKAHCPKCGDKIK